MDFKTYLIGQQPVKTIITIGDLSTLNFGEASLRRLISFILFAGSRHIALLIS